MGTRDKELPALIWVMLFFFNDTATTEIYTLSLHDALPISHCGSWPRSPHYGPPRPRRVNRSEEHTSELQSLRHLVCRLLLEKKKKTPIDQLAGTTRSQADVVHHTHESPTVRSLNRSATQLLSTSLLPV